MQVCQAIQHAHQKGIIHRNIILSNVLVSLHDGVPEPVVIDFAPILGQDPIRSVAYAVSCLR